MDVGFWRYEQRLAQAAADSGATAGSIRLNYPTALSTGTPTDAARHATSLNGFTDDGGVGKVVVTVNVPPNPNTPPHPGSTPYPANQAVEVIVRKKLPQFFSELFGSNYGTTYARSVAASVPDISACLWQLALNGAGLQVNGSKPLQTVNCGVLANGTVTVPGYKYTTSVGYWAPNNPNGVGFPGAQALASPANDPCPRIAGCAYIASQPIPPKSVNDINGKNASSLSVPAGSPYAVVDNCCSNNTVSIGPGLYYFYGGISGTLRGDSVTLVNVDGTFTASGLGAAHPYFSAPTTGSTAGLALYQPPSNTNPITLNGGGNGTSMWNGAFYAPNALGLTSNGGSTTFALLIVGNLTLNGGGTGDGVIVDPTLGSNTSPLLVEYPTHVVLSE